MIERFILDNPCLGCAVCQLAVTIGTHHEIICPECKSLWLNYMNPPTPFQGKEMATALLNRARAQGSPRALRHVNYIVAIEEILHTAYDPPKQRRGAHDNGVPHEDSSETEIDDDTALRLADVA